jgi:hypothetical protein
MKQWVLIDVGLAISHIKGTNDFKIKCVSEGKTLFKLERKKGLLCGISSMIDLDMIQNGKWYVETWAL